MNWEARKDWTAGRAFSRIGCKRTGFVAALAINMEFVILIAEPMCDVLPQTRVFDER